jgi:DNA-directed RNA polymerase subunit RPC12/RpoP
VKLRELGGHKMGEHLCSNCKWEVSVLYDKHDKIFRCSDCGSEIEGHEEDQEEK